MFYNISPLCPQKRDRPRKGTVSANKTNKRSAILANAPARLRPTAPGEHRLTADMKFMDYWDLYGRSERNSFHSIVQIQYLSYLYADCKHAQGHQLTKTKLGLHSTPYTFLLLHLSQSWLHEYNKNHRLLHLYQQKVYKIYPKSH